MTDLGLGVAYGVEPSKRKLGLLGWREEAAAPSEMEDVVGFVEPKIRHEIGDVKPRDCRGATTALLVVALHAELAQTVGPTISDAPGRGRFGIKSAER